MELNVIASPLQGCRDVFDLMPTATQDDWATIATRLTKVPTALEQWTSTLRESADRGLVTPRRQVIECIKQCADLTTPDGFFATFLARASADGAPLDDAVRADLARGVEAAAAALPAPGPRPEHPPARPRSRVGCRGPRALPARLAPVPRRHRRPRGDLRLGAGGAGPHRGRHAARPPTGSCPAPRSRRRSSTSTATRRYQLHGTDALHDWMQERADEVDRRPGRHALRHPGAGAHHRVPDRPDPDRRHLLHRAQRRLQPPGPDVVVGAQGRHRVRHLARADDRLPRGRPRPPPAGRADGLPPRAAQQVAAADVLDVAGTARAGPCTPSG